MILWYHIFKRFSSWWRRFTGETICWKGSWQTTGLKHLHVANKNVKSNAQLFNHCNQSVLIFSNATFLTVQWIWQAANGWTSSWTEIDDWLLPIRLVQVRVTLVDQLIPLLTQLCRGKPKSRVNSTLMTYVTLVKLNTSNSYLMKTCSVLFVTLRHARRLRYISLQILCVSLGLDSTNKRSTRFVLGFEKSKNPWCRLKVNSLFCQRSRPSVTRTKMDSTSCGS